MSDKHFITKLITISHCYLIPHCHFSNVNKIRMLHAALNINDSTPTDLSDYFEFIFRSNIFYGTHTQKKKKFELMKVIIIIIIIIFQKCYFLFIGKRIRLLFNECTRLLMYVEGCAVLEKHLRDGEAADHSRTVLPGCYPLTNPCLPQISG